MAETLEHKQWQGTTDGPQFLHRAIIPVMRWTPLWLHYSVLVFYVLGYLAFSPKSRKVCYRFFRQAMGWGRFKSMIGVVRNHFKFGQVITDRFAKYADKKFNITVEGREIFDDLAAQPGCFLVISSHTGCYEMAGYTLTSTHKRINTVSYGQEVKSIMDNRREQFAVTGTNMIFVSDDMSHLFEINNALRRGEVVSIPGDRLFGSNKFIICDFFGRPAKFPRGPFATAAQRGAPVITAFVMKGRYRDYHMSVKSLTDALPQGLTRAELEQTIAQNFASALEAELRKYPTQWFNYYDFWE